MGVGHLRTGIRYTDRAGQGPHPQVLLLGRRNRKCSREGTALRLSNQAGCSRGKGGAPHSGPLQWGGDSEENGVLPLQGDKILHHQLQPQPKQAQRPLWSERGRRIHRCAYGENWTAQCHRQTLVHSCKKSPSHRYATVTHRATSPSKTAHTPAALQV